MAIAELPASSFASAARSKTPWVTTSMAAALAASFTTTPWN